MSQKIYVTVGFPGSGKSTWARKKAREKNTLIICKDSIRHMLKCSYTFDAAYESFVKEVATSALKKAIQSGFNVIIDNTHITVNQRAVVFDLLKCNSFTNLAKNVNCVWFTEDEKNLEYRMKDSRGYTKLKWSGIISGMKMSFQPPTKEEGFSNVLKIKGDILNEHSKPS